MPGETLTDPIADAVAGLALIPAGPGLAAALACLDLRVLTGSQVVDVLKARYRQNNHDRAQLFAVIAEVMHRGEAETSVLEEYPGEFAADEVRAELVLTRRAADSLCDLAEGVVRRLPSVYQAFAAGVIDQPRVRVFRDWTCALSEEHTAAIVDALQPRAGQLTTAQLMHEIKRHAIALDPTWARRRYERALKGRRVGGSRNEDGTANLSGYDLPVDRVAAACDRFDRLATAAKQAGHPDPIDHLRADLFLGMTDGTYAGLTDTQILARLLAEANLTQAPPAEPAPDRPPAAGSAPAQPAPDGPAPAGSAPAEPADGPSADDRSTVDSPGGEPSGSDRSGRQARSADKPLPGSPDGAGQTTGGGGDPDTGDDATADGETPDSGDPDTGDGATAEGEKAEGETAGGGTAGGGADTAGGVAPGPAVGGLRLLVGLATLAGADARPGELIGWGPVHAELARTIAAAPAASWWYVRTDDDGTPLAIGRVRSRPEGAGSSVRGYPRPQIWLQVNQTTLDALAGRSHSLGWETVIAEIGAKAKAETDTGPPNGDPTARLPGKSLRRWIRVRDRTCILAGCRVPAHRTDADHSVEHANGGATTDTNVAHACRHDHRLRHEGRWSVSHTTPGYVSWTSRLGHTYRRQPPPDITDLPEPMPTSATDEDDADDPLCPSTEDWRNSTCMQPERPQPPAPPPPPPVAPDDDPAPF